jgi:hypothetical protein
MPTRRIVEAAIVVGLLMHPIAAMFRLEAHKHLATSSNPASQTLARVILRVF